MKRYGVRPSVHLSVPAWAHSSKYAAAGLLLWAPGGQDISIDCCSSGVRRANAGSATLSVYVTLVAEHRLVRCG